MKTKNFLAIYKIRQDECKKNMLDELFQSIPKILKSEHLMNQNCSIKLSNLAEPCGVTTDIDPCEEALKIVSFEDSPIGKQIRTQTI